MTLRVGTRGSRLALAQAALVTRLIEEQGRQAEIVVIDTAGDLDRERSFAGIGAPGVFVKELERALVEQRIDLAVHSYKDLPSASPDGLSVLAVPQRVDAADVLVVRDDAFDDRFGFLPLRRGASVGTASARRVALLRDLRSDLRAEFLRGNVPTRLTRLREGQCDAIVLAAAGLERLDSCGGAAIERQGLRFVRLDPWRFVPAPSQGAIAVQGETRREDVVAAVSALDDVSLTAGLQAERTLLAAVQGGCDVPFGAWTAPAGGGESGRLCLVAAFERDGQLLRASAEGDDPDRLAREVGRNLGLPGVS